MKATEKNKNFTIPNALTVLRCILIIPFVVFFIRNNYIAALVVLAVSGITDMLDGWIARKFNQYTELGQMLDPLSDKLTQMAIAVCFAVREPMLVPLLAIFIVKECLMVTGALILISRNKKKPAGSKWYGKTATVMFYISFGVIFTLSVAGKGDNFAVDVVLLSITAVFMIYAFIRYARTYFEILHSDDPKYTLDINEVMDKKKDR